MPSRNLSDLEYWSKRVYDLTSKERKDALLRFTCRALEEIVNNENLDANFRNAKKAELFKLEQQLEKRRQKG